MSEESIKSPLEKATREQLEQILARAEMYLSAQLQSGIAADQRALVFAGFLATGVIALLGAAGALLINQTSSAGYIAVGTAIGLLVALALSIYASRPVDFEFPGNNPCAWEGDIDSNMPLTKSLAGQALHYDHMILVNNAILEKNCGYLASSMYVAFGSLLGGGLAFVGYLAI